MHFVLRGLTLRLVGGELDAPTYGRMLTRMVEETGIENMLKSWIYLDNHDTPRLATAVPDERARRLAQVLQFTLPGSAQPVLRQRTRHGRRRRPRDARPDALGPGHR
jgi:cyclomaltodextrinase